MSLIETIEKKLNVSEKVKEFQLYHIGRGMKRQRVVVFLPIDIVMCCNLPSERLSFVQMYVFSTSNCMCDGFYLYLFSSSSAGLESNRFVWMVEWSIPMLKQACLCSVCTYTMRNLFILSYAQVVRAIRSTSMSFFLSLPILTPSHIHFTMQSCNRW